MTNAYKAHNLLQRLYHYILQHTEAGIEAKEYLKKRGINDETIKNFNIGFCPMKKSLTSEFLTNKGFDSEELLNNNILEKSKSGKPYSLFKNRITFPIQDSAKQTIAFGGRTIDPNNKVKYLNSSESSIFKKENNLFGLNQSKSSIEIEGYAILFEGYFDVLKAHQNNIQNGLASVGTSRTHNQALLIKSITNNIVIAYDGDNAGRENSFRSASVLNKIGCNVHVAEIKGGQDPDEYISENGSVSFLSNIIKQSKNVKLSLLDYKKQEYNLNKDTDRYDYAEEILNSVLKGEQNNKEDTKAILKKLENEMDISFNTMQEEIKNHFNQ